MCPHPWVSLSGTGPPIGPAGGDLSGTYPNPGVAKITGIPVGAIAPGQILQDVAGTIEGVSPGSTQAGQFIISAASVWASLTNGASGISQVETGTNKVNYFVADFLTGVQSFVEVAFPMPSAYDGGTMIANAIEWLTTSASGNTVVWGIQARMYADADAIDQAYGTAVEVTDTNNGANEVNKSAASAAFTPAGTRAGANWVQFRLYRKGTGTLAATARLLGALVSYGQS